MLTPFGELPNELAVDMSMDEQFEWLHRRVSRRSLIKGAGVAGAASALLWTQSAPARGAQSQVYGRHVTYGADPRHQMVVGFACTERVRAATVRLATGQSAVAESQMVTGSSATYLRASFDRLRSETSYNYTIEIDGTSIPGASFRTAPAGPASFRFTAFGDQAVTPDSVAVLGQVADLQPLLHLLAGDLCYADSSGAGGPGDTFHPQAWDRWLVQNEAVSSRVPWMVVPGNHEMEPGFGLHGYAGMLARVAIGGSVPVAAPVATTFRVGSVGFIGLDSNDVSNEISANRGWTHGRQTAWLESTLASYRRSGSGVDFIVVFHHATPYSTSETHGSEGGIRDHWVPLYDKYGVELVISGHAHCYERSLPLRAGQVTSHELAEVDGARGTTYVTAGGGGASFGVGGFGRRDRTRLATPDGPQSVEVDWSTAPRGMNHSVLCVDVSPTGVGYRAQMHLRAITKSGRVLDEWTIRRTTAGPIGVTTTLLPPVADVAVAVGSAAVLLAARARMQSADPAGANREVDPSATPATPSPGADPGSADPGDKPPAATP